MQLGPRSHRWPSVDWLTDEISFGLSRDQASVLFAQIGDLSVRVCREIGSAPDHAEILHGSYHFGGGIR